jgi:Zn-dependent protease with chaperone function
MKPHLVATALALLAMPFCAAAQEAGPQAPPPSRARPDPSTDEAGLWAEMDRAEARARASAFLVTDDQLTSYVRGVACRVAAEHCGDLRFYVMAIPIANAQMAPNGYSEIWTGLLLRIENEAQLAFVLSHETTHFVENHSIERWRALRNRSNLALIASAGIAVAGIDAAMDYPEAAQDILEATGHLIDAIHLATIASIFGFSRENEQEADALGFDRMLRAGYDPVAGATLWSTQIAGTNASDNPDVRRREARASIFNTHPLNEDRVEALRHLAQEHPIPGETFRGRYRAAIRPHLDGWLRAELRGRDFGQTLYILDRLAAHGEDLGLVEFYRGEIHRIRRGEGDRERAVQHYANSTAQPDAPAAAWRELGEYAARDQRNAEAAAYFTSYLERAPNAEDRALIEARLAQLNGGGQ